jgi:hypothetical protein
VRSPAVKGMNAALETDLFTHLEPFQYLPCLVIDEVLKKLLVRNEMCIAKAIYGISSLRV